MYFFQQLSDNIIFLQHVPSPLNELRIVDIEEFRLLNRKVDGEVDLPVFLVDGDRYHEQIVCQLGIYRTVALFPSFFKFSFQVIQISQRISRVWDQDIV